MHPCPVPSAVALAFRRVAAGIVLAGVVVACGACSFRKAPTGHAGESGTLTATAYAEEGDDLFLAVDVRASRVGESRTYLPVLVALHNKNPELWRFTRESFRLELPDGRMFPLVPYREFRDRYGRDAADRRLGVSFVESLETLFPRPPYSRLDLEFYPPRNRGGFPRDDVELRRGQIGLGWLYFPLPDDAPREGRYRLLVQPSGIDSVYVLDFPPFAEASR